MVGAAAAAAGGAGHVSHGAASVNYDCKLFGGCSQVQGGVEVAADGAEEGKALVGGCGALLGALISRQAVEERRRQAELVFTLRGRQAACWRTRSP